MTTREHQWINPGSLSTYRVCATCGYRIPVSRDVDPIAAMASARECKPLRARDIARRKPVTVGDLAKAPSDASLLCDECGQVFSATHGDYSFRLPAGHVLRCCGKPMRLVRRVVKYETVRT